jgi:hypothetical protein
LSAATIAGIIFSITMKGAIVFVAGLILVCTASAGTAAQPGGRYFLRTRGLWTYFEHLGAEQGYNSGELLEVIGQPSVRADVVAQLKRMRALGVNEFAYEMRSADGPWPVNSDFPACQLSTALGPKWPQPAAVQLSGLQTLFALAHQFGMRVILILNTTHMEQGAVGNAQWLGAIAGAIKDSPAFDLLLVGGDVHAWDAQPPFDGVPDSCGGESEAPLWLGPDSVQGRYVQWALGYLRSLGIPAEKLSAEAIVGFYGSEVQQPAGTNAEDSHLWRPLEVLRTIFDRLGFAPDQRAYALSYYAHSKCAFVQFAGCSDENELTWTKETLETSKARVEPQARLLLAEFGANPGGNYQRAVEMIGADMRVLGIDGGTYYKWADETNNPQYTDPASVVKKRGLAFVYNPQERELADLYGFHLTAVPNGSFENGTSQWTTTGSGTAQISTLQEDLPWRGVSYVRLTGARTYSLSSTPIRISPSTRYTTTANLRFPQPNVRAVFTYLTCRRKQSAKTKRALIQLTTRQPTWQTFPFTYTTPSDACFVRITFSLAGAGRLDIDDVR